LPCEKECEANPILLARILVRLTSLGTQVLEVKRYRLQLGAGAAVDAAALWNIAPHPGWRPRIEAFFYTVGTGAPTVTPQTLELAFVDRQETLVSAATTGRRSPIVPTSPYRSATGGCVYVPREDESPQWWRIFARLGREGGAAANLEVQVVWVPVAYQFEERNWGGRPS